MHKQLLTLLRCPVTHKGLSLARPDLLAKINAAVAAGRLRNRDGATLSEPLQEALTTDDGKLMYPVTNGIPVLLEGDATSLDEL